MADGRGSPGEVAATTRTDDLVGIVLAGGASRRMGRDKALLRLTDGRSLLEHSLGVLRGLGAEALRVAGSRRADLGGEAICIADAVPGLGPLGGIASVIGAEAPRVGRLWLALPVDLPAIGPHSLQPLLQAVRGDSALAGAHFEGHPLPLLLRESTALRDALWQLLQDREGMAAGAFAAAQGCAVLPLDAAGAPALCNVNTPEAWRPFGSPTA